MFKNDMRSAVKKASEFCKAVAAGDFEARIINIPEKGEAAEFLHSINLMIDRVDAYIRDIQSLPRLRCQEPVFPAHFRTRNGRLFRTRRSLDQRRD